MDCQQARKLFPVVNNYAYLNNAADCPLPAPVAEAMVSFIEDAHSFGCMNFEKWLENMERARSLFAKLINCQTTEVAFVKNTTQGLIIAAEAIPMRRGDLIVVNDMEFPSNYHPWSIVAKKRGLRVKTIRSRVGRITPDMVEQAINRQVRVLALSAVQYENGFFADLEAIGKLCADNGTYFVVDGIQACGVMPVDVKKWQASMLSTGGHKWMMSVGGCGFLYVNQECLDKLSPVNVGWLGMKDPLAFSQNLDFADGARRFEEGTPSMVAIFALKSALQLLHAIGIENIRDHVFALNEHLVRGLESKAYRVESPQEPAERSAITLFRGGPLSARMLAERLAEAGVVCALRARGIRVSPHLYNSFEDIDRLLDALP